MKYKTQPLSKIINFEIGASGRELIDELAFVHLIAMKFDGEEFHASCSFAEKQKLYFFKLRFPSANICSSAEAHCKQSLTETGDIVDDYRKALDTADPRRMMASIIKERAENNFNDELA